MTTTRIALWHTVLAALFVGGLTASAAFAHHGWTHYDQAKTLTLNGVITEVSYSNPHASIRLQADGKDAKTWLAVLAPPTRMKSRGLAPELLKVGTSVSVVGYPHRTEQDELRAERLIIGDKTIELR